MAKLRLLLIGIVIFILPASAARAGLYVSKSADKITARTDAFKVEVRLDNGLLNAWWGDGAPLIRNAFSLWQIVTPDGSKVIASAGDKKRSVVVQNFVDRVGEGKKAEITFPADELGLSFTISYRFYEGKPFFIVLQTVRNVGGGALRIDRAIPLQAEAQRRGGFFPGPDPSMVWALENGYKFMFDFYVRAVKAIDPVVSNWDAAYYDRTTQRTTMIGFLTADRARVGVRSYHDPEGCEKEGSWTAVTSIKAEASYEPSAPLKKNEVFEAERLYVGVSTETAPHPTLERFADAVAEHYRIKPWSKPIPTGWNSWATRYHADISEQIILDNARSAAKNLGPFGMTYFQIDDGWQQMVGDWEPNGRFPNGMKYVADELRTMGFIPGIWIAPFVTHVNSALAREHPNWIMQKNDIMKQVVSKEWLLLDITNPEFKQWLRALFEKIGREWGFGFIKTDYVYYSLFADGYYNPDITTVEAYREAMKIIKQALPPDAFLVEVAVPVVNSIGIADGMRLGLDIKPDWADDEGYLTQGFKPMVRNVARRYWMNRRVWINHPDMFYLGSPEETERWGTRVTLEEARCYATLASLSGEITKIGDSFTGLDSAQIDMLRKIMPVYPGNARPIDLFEHLYPEVWHLPVRTQDLDYDVVGMFNWGRNRSWGVATPEQTETIRVNLADLGLSPTRRYIVSEFWTGEPRGEIEGSLEAVLLPRTVRVFAVHELRNRPQLIGDNRHITQGATDIKWVEWNPVKKTLAGRQKLESDFEYKLMFHVPDDVKFIKAAFEDTGLVLDSEVRGDIVTVRFSDPSASERSWTLFFE